MIGAELILNSSLLSMSSATRGEHNQSQSANPWDIKQASQEILRAHVEKSNECTKLVVIHLILVETATRRGE